MHGNRRSIERNVIARRSGIRRRGEGMEMDRDRNRCNGLIGERLDEGKGCGEGRGIGASYEAGTRDEDELGRGTEGRERYRFSLESTQVCRCLM